MSNYKLEDLLANIRTHIPDFDMATEIMKRLRAPQAQVDVNTSYALEAFERVLGSLVSTTHANNKYQSVSGLLHTREDINKVRAFIAGIEKHIELIEGELTAAYMAGVESMRGKARPVVDVEALKKPNLKALDHGYKSMYNKGWNDCLDHLKEKGLI